MDNLELCRQAGEKAARAWRQPRYHQDVTLDDHKLNSLFEFERDSVISDRRERLKRRNAFLTGFDKAQREASHA